MTASKSRIMLVDDDLTIIEALTYNLHRHGFETIIFNDGRTALAALTTESPDLIILDWMLPDMVGPEICKVIRTRSLDIPILMLTGRSTPADVAEGLTSGADDYLGKPFSAIELLARVQAILRRVKRKTAAAGSAKLAIGDLILDEDSRRVTKSGKNVDLSPKEFQLLKVLMSNSGKTLSTEALLNQVWGYDFTGDVKTVAVHVRWLRQKLEADPKNPQLLETVHRSGYRFNTPEQQTLA